jgi:DUF4097 and DUF4098 domain-containing protein YvlB
VLATSACVVSVGSQGYTAREERRFSVTETPDVHLVTFDGSIEVRTWDHNEVLVEIEKRGQTKDAVDSIQLTADQTGSRVQVEARRPDGGQAMLGFGLRMSRSANFVATVPRNANVMVRTGDGSVRVEQVTGRAELRTGDGTVRGAELKGSVTVDSGDGSVTLQDVDGSIDVRTGDGGVSVAGRLTAVRVRTSDGSVTVRAETGSAMSDDWDISTADGSVAVYLPEPFDAELDAHTGDGRVTTDQSIVMAGGKTDRGTLRGRLGSGGRALKVRTGDGSIHVRIN